MPVEETVPPLNSPVTRIPLDLGSPHIVVIDPASPFQGLWSTFYEDTYNALLDQGVLDKDAARVDSFATEEVAKRVLLDALRQANDHVIRILQPWYKKTGDASVAWSLMQDGMLVSEYRAVAKDCGISGSKSWTEVEYNVENKLIQLV